jgi:uncharacterized protein YbjT (DUF2867 family)
MASARYVVIGATGNVGSVIAEALLADGRSVRVVGRDAARLKRFTERGAEAAAGSIDDPGFTRSAIAGASAVFVMVPPNIDPGYRAFQLRAAAALEGAIDAARPAHAMTLSSVGADVPEGTGPVAGLHDLERRLDAMPGLSVLHLRPTYYFENHLEAVGMVKAAGFLGSPLAADLNMGQIATRDIGELAARRMLALDWSGREVHELHGERDLTMPEVTAAIGKAIGKPDLRYVAFSYADALQGMIEAGLPEDAASLFVELARALNEGVLRPSQPRSPATTTPTSIEWFAENVFAPAFREAR